MKDLEHSLWSERAFDRGNHSVECLSSDGNTAQTVIVHHPGRVFVRLAYWRAGVLKEHFLEIPDCE